MRPYQHILRSALAIAVAMVFLIAFSSTQVSAAKKGRGRGGHGGHGHRGHGHGGHGLRLGGHYGSGHHFGIRPYGISYGYLDSGISVHVGRPYGYTTPHDGYSRGYYSSPYYVPRNYYYESFNTVPNYYYKTKPNVVDSRPNDEEKNTAPRSTGVRVIATNEHAAEYQSAAERAFHEKRYNDAARLARHAVVEDAGNGKLYLFQSQALFAIGDYQGAADLIHEALAMLGVSDWGYVVENAAKFYSGRDYVTQMEHLVEHAKQNPNLAHLQFLRGYHYLYLGYHDAARKLLTRASELDNRDDLTRSLLAMVLDELPPPPDFEKRPSSNASR